MLGILDLIQTVMGLGVIEENLQKLLTAMETMHKDVGLGLIMSYAKMIGLCLALGVGANECFQMMLGRRGIDVMKILHIIIISLCISSAGTIAAIARVPGKQLEFRAQAQLSAQNVTITELQNEVADAQEDYLKKVRENMRKLEEAQKAADQKESDGWWDDMVNAVEQGYQHIGNIVKEYTLLTETKICEWISLIIRLIGEVLLQAIYYGILVSQRIFMHILEAFAPLMFAISLSPHFKSAWSQWLSKYISVSLWGFVAYTCMVYVMYIIEYNLTQDVTAYSELLSNVTIENGDDAQIGVIGMQALGSTCMYIVGVLIGIKVLSFVPEVASWLIPGGVSSGAGAAAERVPTQGAQMAAKQAWTGIKSMKP